MTSVPRAVRIAATGDAASAGPDLEDRFPGRWDPRRSLDPVVGILVQALAGALERAGWWRAGSGEVVPGGLVVGTDVHGVDRAARFAALPDRSGGPRLAPSEYLLALPSSASSVAGLLFGLAQYRATVSMHGLSGPAAVSHAAGLLRAGRLERAVVATLTAVGPAAARALGVPEGEETPVPFARAVVWCLEIAGPAAGARARDPGQGQGRRARDPGHGGVEVEDAGIGPAFLLPAGATLSADFLGDVPAPFRGLAAPGLLAAGRAADRLAKKGAACTVFYRDHDLGGTGWIRLARG
ncbi:MAG: hypothetical protein HY720_32295 [Planctomycetes bacterium]|nr:hypothetical protein [Planctomycetota bacterium]